MKKTSQLHELLAVENDLTNTVKKIMDESYNIFSKKHNHFLGQVRALEYNDEAREKENGSESKEIVTSVTERLLYTFKPVERLFNALLQKEEANQRAKADLIVDGKTIATDLPATFLLGMESRLKNLQTVLLTIPTLEPSMIWTKDNSKDEETYRSNPVKTTRTEKTVKHEVLYEATKEHPAQIEKWNEDKVVAMITTTHFSAMWSSKKKADTLERLDKLIRAVKKSRQRANTVTIDKSKSINAIFNYILD